MTIRNNTRVVRSHNEYVQALADLGLVGFTLFLWFLVQVFRSSAEGLRYLRTRSDWLWWFGLNLGLVGFSITAFFAFPLQVPTSSIYFFILVGLSTSYTRVLRARETETNNDWIKLDLEDGDWRVPALWAVTGVFAGSVLTLETFTYNALVGEVRNKEARVYKRYKRWDEAYALLTDAINHYPWMEGYYYDRAVVQMQRKKMNEALQDLRKTAELVPNYAMGRKQIAMLAQQMGMTELAVNEFKATMNIYKQQREELTLLIGRTALRGRRPDLAIPVLKETLELEGDNLTKKRELLRMLADAYGMSGKGKESLEVFEQLRALGDWDENLAIRYAMALDQTGKVSEAESQLRQLTRDAPTNASGWYALARIRTRAGDVTEAVQMLDRAISLDPKLDGRARRDPLLTGKPAIKAWLNKR